MGWWAQITEQPNSRGPRRTWQRGDGHSLDSMTLEGFSNPTKPKLITFKSTPLCSPNLQSFRIRSGEGWEKRLGSPRSGSTTLWQLWWLWCPLFCPLFGLWPKAKPNKTRRRNCYRSQGRIQHLISFTEVWKSGSKEESSPAGNWEMDWELEWKMVF